VNPLEEDEEKSWPDEPDEFDPDSLGPDPPDPTPTLQESLDTAADVPDDLFRAFWASVLLLNVALAALSLGAMLVYFRGDYEAGGPALLIGAVAALATARYYWRFKTGHYAETEDGNKERDVGGSEETDDPAVTDRSASADGSGADTRTEIGGESR